MLRTNNVYRVRCKELCAKQPSCWTHNNFTFAKATPNITPQSYPLSTFRVQCGQSEPVKHIMVIYFSVIGKIRFACLHHFFSQRMIAAQATISHLPLKLYVVQYDAGEVPFLKNLWAVLRDVYLSLCKWLILIWGSAYYLWANISIVLPWELHVWCLLTETVGWTSDSGSQPFQYLWPLRKTYFTPT